MEEIDRVREAREGDGRRRGKYAGRVCAGLRCEPEHDEGAADARDRILERAPDLVAHCDVPARAVQVHDRSYDVTREHDGSGGERAPRQAPPGYLREPAGEHRPQLNERA